MNEEKDGDEEGRWEQDEGHQGRGRRMTEGGG